MGLLERARLSRGGSCEHLEAIDEPAQPRARRCEECDARVPLRVCLTCGHVGCCDSRAGHAGEHARASGHPVIRALPRGFTYCYEDESYL